MNTLLPYLNDISALGNFPILLGAIVVLVVLYLLRGHCYSKVGAVLVSLGSYPLALLLKALFRQPRPAGFNPVVYIKWDVYSFPSAHTLLYTVFFGYIFYLTFVLCGMDKVLRHVIRFLALVLVLLVGVSRVALGAHSVTDVIFGYLFGLIYLLAVIGLERFWEQKQAVKQLKRR